MLVSAFPASLTAEKAEPLPDWNSINPALQKLRERHQLQADKPALIVDPSRQQLYVLLNGNLMKTFPVSTSYYGIGNEKDSNKTPPGTHRIREKIGQRAKQGSIFISRINTHRIADILTDDTDTPKDLVLSRIMWLDGQEPGINKGGDIDSHDRFVYIHGTPEEGLIGTPASHGCIRMKNADVITLFDMVEEGTLVEILNKPYPRKPEESGWVPGFCQ